MVPPSIPLVVFGVTTQLSVTKLFMASTDATGLMMAVTLAATWWLVARKELRSGRRPRFELRLFSVRNGVWALVTSPFVIIGGMKAGVFTPTEAAVVAVIYSLFTRLFVPTAGSTGARCAT